MRWSADRRNLHHVKFACRIAERLRRRSANASRSTARREIAGLPILPRGLGLSGRSSLFRVARREGRPRCMPRAGKFESPSTQVFGDRAALGARIGVKARAGERAQGALVARAHARRPEREIVRRSLTRGGRMPGRHDATIAHLRCRRTRARPYMFSAAQARPAAPRRASFPGKRTASGCATSPVRLRRGTRACALQSPPPRHAHRARTRGRGADAATFAGATTRGGITTQRRRPFLIA